MTDHINTIPIKLTRAVKSLFAMTGDCYESEFGDDKSHKREFCRRIAEHYAGLIGCKVVDVEFAEASKHAYGALVGATPPRGSIQWKAKERLGAALGFRRVKSLQSAKSSKMPPIATAFGAANSSATEAAALAEQIIELADSPDLPSAAIDYAESVADKARDILASVESENRATPGQIEALKNMLNGLERWFE